MHLPVESRYRLDKDQKSNFRNLFNNLACSILAKVYLLQLGFYFFNLKNFLKNSVIRPLREIHSSCL